MIKLLKKGKDGMIPSVKGEAMLNEILTLQKTIEGLTNELNEMKTAFKEQMISNGIDSMNYNNCTLSVRKPYERTSKKVDYKGLMARGLYDKYVTETKTIVESSLVIKVNE